MTDLEQVEIQIEMANKLRKLRDNCVKLTANKAWKDVIDEGYLTHKQFCDYNNLKEIYEDELTDDEIWSMTNSNEL